MTTSVDLEAYFERVQWGGNTDPTFDTLAGLLRSHVARIPFENLDVLLGRKVRLDLDSVQGKLVRAGRGGYCFEHATLFAAVLETLGFDPIRHAARVILYASRTEMPRTHMFLTVPVEGARFVVDPGFGPFAASAPLPLVDDTDTIVDARTHRLVRDGELWVLEANYRDQRIPAWVTTLEAENRIDFEVANHYTATHPGSPFTNRLMLSAVTAEGRVNVMNREVTVSYGNETRSSQLADRAELRALLAEHFGFDMPEVEQLHVPSIDEWQ
jgi:N-hydroxyarylamine O-acetyltransferase